MTVDNTLIITHLFKISQHGNTALPPTQKTAAGSAFLKKRKHFPPQSIFRSKEPD
jgi:hypothetical protein